MKRTTIILLLLLSVFAFTLPAAAYAQTTHSLRPTTSCYDDNCDGYVPPPVSSCNSSNVIEETINIEDSINDVIGHLDLHASLSNGCFSWWTNIWSARGGWKVTAVGVWEGNADGSSAGGLDSMPHSMNTGSNESTYMIGDKNVAPTPCFHGAVDYVDEYGIAFGPLNTGTFCQ